MTETKTGSGPDSFIVRAPGSREDQSWLRAVRTPGEVCCFCGTGNPSLMGERDWFACPDLGGVIAHENCARVGGAPVWAVREAPGRGQNPAKAGPTPRADRESALAGAQERFWDEVRDGKVSDTGLAFAEVLQEVLGMLLTKNRAYGNSALEPVRVFSKASAEEQILVRIDDKLSRLARGSEAGEDTVMDLIGYLVLLRAARRGA